MVSVVFTAEIPGFDLSRRCTAELAGYTRIGKSNINFEIFDSPRKNVEIQLCRPLAIFCQKNEFEIFHLNPFKVGTEFRLRNMALSFYFQPNLNNTA